MAYVEGFVVPVPRDKVSAYMAMSREIGEIWREHGALRFCECLADDVKPGQWTSFPQSVDLKDNELVVFAWIEFDSREARDAVKAKVEKDARSAKWMEPGAFPFDGKRMIYGGFALALDL